MKILLFIFLVTPLIFISFRQEQNNKKIFQQLKELQGTWRMETSGSVLYERWNTINDTLMQSTSYQLKQKDTLLLEQVSLQHTRDGIFYIPVVKENNMTPIPFKLTSNSNNSFVFENPHHDFPKRIVYEIVSADSLHAYIDDGTNNASKRSDYFFKRIPQ
ncbi:MAG TPA: DUF6265 family protein [Chitinophagaceae bacterium]